MKRFKICVIGGEEGKAAEKAKPLARKIGKEVAKRGHILVTGATTGVPFAAALAAKKAGGISIGFSPAGSELEHQKKYRLPTKKAFDHIFYTEEGYTGRDLLMVRTVDASVMIDGRIGTLHEFTIAFEEHEIIGVLEGSGGMADEIKRILTAAKKGQRKVIFASDPIKLVDKVIKRIKKEK